MAWRRRNIPILACLFWFVVEKTRTIDLCSDLFLKNGSRKTNEILKKCRIDTIGQESENRKTNLESEESESGNWIMITTIFLLFSDLALISHSPELHLAQLGGKRWIDCYVLQAIQLGPTEASRYWIYWVPAQYVDAIKDTILGKWQPF